MGIGIKDFPFLDRAEFAAACHHLDRQYCHATLGLLRRRWKLRLCTALDSGWSVDGGYTTYIQVTRPLEPAVDPGNLSLGMGRVSISEQDAVPTADQDMADAEELDSVRRTCPRRSFLLECPSRRPDPTPGGDNPAGAGPG